MFPALFSEFLHDLYQDGFPSARWCKAGWTGPNTYPMSRRQISKSPGWVCSVESTSTTKSTKWPVRPAKTQIILGIRPVWSVFAVCMKKPWVLSYPLSAQRRLWSDWVDAQADLSLLWVHSHFVGEDCRKLLFNCHQIPTLKVVWVFFSGNFSLTEWCKEK